MGADESEETLPAEQRARALIDRQLADAGWRGLAKRNSFAELPMALSRPNARRWCWHPPVRPVTPCAAGATLHARARVNSLERRGKRFFIQTARGPLQAESVLVGTSGYTGSATKKLQKKVIPIGSFIIATEKLSDELAYKLSPKNRMIFDSMHYLNYFRLWDNRMIFGGRA